ncbi:alpha/beta fold hydrolase [Nocardioides sp. URHA0020]|uniref:alpha/beta fold hydrolase n=1 Tax=Nocardioides sp. URHA0020 TaxID=1380392 RepID=UPI0006864E45|nr:alpha/beta hydrolase [Nocardioides sp. URHA0020]
MTAAHDLVAVPGLGLGAEAWSPCLEALSTGPGTVRTLPGYGEPTAGSDALWPVDLAARLCDGLSGPTTLLGHSSSCQVVAHAARVCPELVQRIVLVGPTTDPRAVSWSALAGRWLRNAIHEDPRQLPRLVRQYRRTTLRSMRATMDRARHDDIRATLSSVRCPVVLVRGAHDHIARSDWVHALAALGAPTVVVELPAAAHMAPQTHPDLVADHLDRHLT